MSDANSATDQRREGRGTGDASVVVVGGSWHCCDRGGVGAGVGADFMGCGAGVMGGKTGNGKRKTEEGKGKGCGREDPN
ncbi:MAG: hypothetical protein WC977_01460 [Anaerovoracaceae bacterium]